MEKDNYTKVPILESGRKRKRDLSHCPSGICQNDAVDALQVGRIPGNPKEEMKRQPQKCMSLARMWLLHP